MSTPMTAGPPTLVQADPARLGQLLPVGPGAPAEDVARGGHEVPNDVRANDRLAGDHPQVVGNWLALDDVRCRNDHAQAPPSMLGVLRLLLSLQPCLAAVAFVQDLFAVHRPS